MFKVDAVTIILLIKFNCTSELTQLRVILLVTPQLGVLLHALRAQDVVLHNSIIKFSSK